MKTKIKLLLICVLFLIVITSCNTSNSFARLYSEQSISADAIKIRTIAIVPNRMPITMQDPEYWRKYNWDLIASKFTERGFKVIDYNTTITSFTRSGLPLEDTKSSRDKYAEFASDLNVELVIIPYYGTSYNLKSGFTQNTHNFLSIGSLQFYYAPKNDFIARIDFEGHQSTETNAPGAYAILGLFPLLADASDPESITTMTTLSSVFSLLFLLNDLLAPTDPDDNWKTGFRLGISKATETFFSRFSPTNYNNNSPYNNTSPQQVTPTSNYSAFSIEELELLKKNAVEKKDFKKAAELKAEIDSRKK